MDRSGRLAISSVCYYSDHTRPILFAISGYEHLKIVSEYDQEIQQSQTADNAVAPLFRVLLLRIKRTVLSRINSLVTTFFKNNI